MAELLVLYVPEKVTHSSKWTREAVRVAHQNGARSLHIDSTASPLGATTLSIAEYALAVGFNRLSMAVSARHWAEQTSVLDEFKGRVLVRVPVEDASGGKIMVRLAAGPGRAVHAMITLMCEYTEVELLELVDDLVDGQRCSVSIVGQPIDSRTRATIEARHFGQVDMPAFYDRDHMAYREIETIYL